ncbi:unnamed protein product [Meganyctiphanes norvegica]|uniref:G-protein coupled receptors family 1 profile domain-containing protein n=1 Tax=Meganyctiphanes norvegica TaxID=48144 RepID=A0AAV2S5B3_MEGNR
MITNNTTVDYYVPADVAEVLQFRYHIAMPIFVAMAVITNSLALIVARRSAVKELHVNQYIVILATVDICSSLSLIPHMFDTEFCTYSDHTFALYHAYFGQAIGYYCRYIGTYALLSLSLDRFLGIWFNQIFQKIKGATLIRLRIILVWITISVIPHVLLGKVSLQSNNEWLALPGYRNMHHPWLDAYEWYAIIVFAYLPSIGLISLSIGLVIGIIVKTMEGPSTNRQRNVTFAVLAMNVFYLVSTPIARAILLPRYNIGEGGCYSDATTEWFKSVSNYLLMTWTVTHLLTFFAINKIYRDDIKVILSSFKHFRRVESPMLL